MKPRILFLHHSAAIGGAERQLLMVSRHSRETGDVVLFADGPLRELLEKNGVRVRVILSHWAAQGARGGAPNFSLRNLIDVLRLAWRSFSDVDLTVANSPRALFVGALIRLVRRKPLLWLMHDLLDETHFHRRGIQLIVCVANRSASRIISNSKASADAFVTAGGRADLLRIVYPGVAAPASFTETSRDVATIGVFGRITPWKGQDIVLRALAQTPGVTAIFVGEEEDADYANALRKLVEQLGLTSRVKFLGFRAGIAELMQEVDCVVHASTAPEPFGLVIVEGMLAKHPVIATRAGGAVEIIEDGVSGLLVRPGDPKEMAAAISRIFSNPAEAKRLARNGYERARSVFGEERFLWELEDQFREVAGV